MEFSCSLTSLADSYDNVHLPVSSSTKKCSHRCINIQLVKRCAHINVRTWKEARNLLLFFLTNTDTHRRTYTRTRAARKRRKACYQAELASFFASFFSFSSLFSPLSPYHVICRQRKRVPYVCVCVCLYAFVKKENKRVRGGGERLVTSIDNTSAKNSMFSFASVQWFLSYINASLHWHVQPNTSRLEAIDVRASLEGGTLLSIE